MRNNKLMPSPRAALDAWATDAFVAECYPSLYPVIVRQRAFLTKLTGRGREIRASLRRLRFGSIKIVFGAPRLKRPRRSSKVKAELAFTLEESLAHHLAQLLVRVARLESERWKWWVCVASILLPLLGELVYLLWLRHRRLAHQPINGAHA
jgi:hypothetical protein